IGVARTALGVFIKQLQSVATNVLCPPFHGRSLLVSCGFGSLLTNGRLLRQLFFLLYLLTGQLCLRQCLPCTGGDLWRWRRSWSCGLGYFRCRGSLGLWRFGYLRCLGHEFSPQIDRSFPWECPGSGDRDRRLRAGHYRSMAYAPLHVHTEHSALDGLARLDMLAKAIADGGMKAGAITDHGSLGGLWEFSQSAKKHGIKPIPGMEAYLAVGSRHQPGAMQFYNDDGMGDASDEITGRMKRKQYYHVTVLARNRTGWHNLILLHNESQKTKLGIY